MTESVCQINNGCVLTEEVKEKSNSLTVPEAQEEFIEILRKLNNSGSQSELLSWIQCNWLNECETISNSGDDTLQAIAADLRERMPLALAGVLPSENILQPVENAEYNLKHTVQVDEFLYDDDQVQQMCESGVLPAHYCLDCGSHCTKELEYVSHSVSREKLAYIFQALLPPLSDLTVLDIGSRLGAMLYGAYLFSKASRIVGVEINSDFCKLQRDVIQKYNFKDRVSVVEADIITQPNLVNTADVIVLNNVFEFFMDPARQADMWKFLRKNVKPGAVLVTVPSLAATLSGLQTDIDLSQWVEELPLYNPNADALLNVHDKDVENIKHYKVV
ncbi:uncharacterized protein LOC134527895 isoform X2 [Bacillus rossius redtenbacheri]|uniref:uncharacterized protein LOC134527895 isoform X2 n=1 Tax=Bacillus rossius redtenbacheri TaxID=93214 RepID=UPI002FDEF019